MNWLSGHFLNERLLFGALGAVVPVAIHLLNRARFDVRGWGAMMFLQSAVEARANRIRIQQFILLALRCLFFAALAIALARPVATMVKASDVGQRQATTTALVIDASGSTRSGESDARPFEEIRRTALSIVSDMSANDDLLVIQAGVKSTPLYPSPLSDKEFVSRKIQAMQPGFGRARLSEALTQATLLLNESTKPRRQIIVLTDGQSVSWPAAESPEWEEFLKVRSLSKFKPSVYVLPHPESSPTTNVRIARIKQDFPIVDVYRRNRFTVDVVNGGERRRTRLDLLVGGKLESERELDLQPGANAVSFDVTFQQSGSNYLQVVMPGDGLEADNSCVLATQVVKRIPILLIEGNSDPHPLSSDGGCLRMALSSAASGVSDALLKVTVRNQTAMDEMDSAYLNRFKSIVLANVTSLSMHFRLRIEQYVERGGGLFITLGPNVDPDNYNVMFRETGGLLPALLKGNTPSLESPVIPVIQGADTPIFANVDAGRDSMLQEIRIRRFHATTAANDARVLVSCNESPLLLHKGFGNGQVIMWTSSVTPGWSNFPLTEDFLPIMQNVLVTLSGNVSPPVNLGLGETLFYSTRPNSLRDLAQSRMATLSMPNGTKTTLPITFDDGQWVGRFDDTQTPGLYSVRLADGAPTYYSVQLDADEGDLTLLDTGRQATLTERLGTNFFTNVNELNARIAQEQPPNEYWLLFLIAAAALLVAELFLGHRYS